MKNKWLIKAIKANIIDVVLAILSKIFFATSLVLLSYSLSYLLDNYGKGQTAFNNAVLFVVAILIGTILVSFLSDYFKSKYIMKVNIYIRNRITEKIIAHTEDLISSKIQERKYLGILMMLKKLRINIFQIL